MKTFQSFIFFPLFSLASNSVLAQQSETIKVWGNCGMCKKVIETAALKAGATKANWSETTHELQVNYKVKKTSASKIQEAIAAAGYDTQDFTAPNDVYSKLHGCCQYERKAVSSPAKDSDKMACCDNGTCEKHAVNCADCGKCEAGKSCCKSETCQPGKQCCKK
jgi:hypothetical protein